MSQSTDVRRQQFVWSLNSGAIPLVKMLLAIIRPTKLQAVQAALSAIGVERMTVCDSHGYGRQRGQTETYRGLEYEINLLRKVVLEIVVNDDFVERTISTIESIARTGEEGNIGDGKIFQLPVSDAVQVMVDKSNEPLRGPEAV